MMGFSDPAFWQSFWPGFWSNLAADFIVGILIASFLSWLFSKRQRLEAMVDAVILTRSETAVKLQLDVVNSGNVAFRGEEIFCHIYVGPELQVLDHTFSDAATDPVITMEPLPDGRSLRHYRTMLTAPVFPEVPTGFVTLDVAPPMKQPLDVCYWLSTAVGIFPRGFKTSLEGEKWLRKIGRVQITE